MIKPRLSGTALREDIQQAARQENDLHLWWLGQSGFLVQWQGCHLLLDPYLSDSLTRKYANTDKPHVRMTELPIEPSQLDFIDVVTSSHNHTDHLDADTLTPLMRVNAELQVVVPSANRQFAAERLGVPAERLTTVDDGQSIMSGVFTLHGVPAAHETVQRDAQQQCFFLGYVIECGPWTIYHSGDTMLYDGLVERLSDWDIHVAILPINGRTLQRRVAGNLWGREAAQLARDVRAQLVIPCHYDMFEFNTVTPEEFVATAEALGQPYHVLECGERWSSRELATAEPSRDPLTGKLACVKVYPSRLEAEYAATILEQAEIHTLVSVDDAGGMYAGFALTSSGGAKLMVLERDLDRAEELLAAD